MEFEHNLKDRLLWCEVCKNDVITNEPSPRCKTCGHKLVTVVYNGSVRITGVPSEHLEIPENLKK